MGLNVLPEIISFLKVGSSSGILQFIQSSGYFFMYILMTLEGPIVTYAAAFASSLGIFNVFYVFLLSSLGNITGDIILFYVGRFSKKERVENYAHNSLSTSRMDRLKRYLERNPGKTIATVKLTPFLPVPGLILIGSSNMGLKKFAGYSILFSMISASVMVLLGFYSGIAVLTFAKYVKYVEHVVIGAILLTIIVFILIKFVSKKISGKMEKI